MSALLLGAFVALLFAAAWQLVGEHGERGVERARRRLTGEGPTGIGSAALRRGAADRLEGAALDDRLGPGAVIAAKLGGAVLSAPLAATVAPVLPGRFGLLVGAAVPLAAFLAPDLLLARIAATRRARIAEGLPDALDLMATGAAAGRGVGPLIGEAMRSSRGPLREELARAAAEIECGGSQQAALGELRRRGAGSPLAAIAAALERSRRHGSPLTRALHEQAGSLRGDQRRRIGERAARAAPKMQLVVALLLVPSVLLIVAAAIIANSGSILPSF